MSKESDTKGSTATTTVEEPTTLHSAGGEPIPGVLLFVADQKPRYEPYRLGARLVAGRGGECAIPLSDSLVSREHTSIRFDGSRFEVTDLGSRNGTWVGGERIRESVHVSPNGVVRLGGSLLLLCSDIRALALESVSVQRSGVIGPAMREALKVVARAASYGRTLLVTGESGTGKELVARAFHEQGPHADGPFVAANSGAIPEGVAERLLFGSRRGAFSGATDASGLAQRAHGGTLFLDEVAELPLAVQTKLLRLLEAGEVQRLGGDRSEKVDVNVCAATWRDLRAAVVDGSFREDLYFRIGRPEVRLPPLRARAYEIPWHVADELSRLDGELTASAAFIEACALRPWPGNIRELRAEVRRSAALAAEAGRITITAEDLDPRAGMAFERDDATSERAGAPDDDDEVAQALRAEAGNVTRAARRLGVHRNKIRRWLERRGIDPKTYRD